MKSKHQPSIEVVPRIADIPAEAWDACANPDPAAFNPFIAHGFLKALEDAGTVGGRTGWTPRHLVLKDAPGEIVGCAPCYLKSHSQGEYVFDHAWAEAYERAGGRYYPKLQIAVPFTPVPGRRLLVRPGPDAEASEALLAAAAAAAGRAQRAVGRCTSRSSAKANGSGSARAASCSAPTSSSIGATRATAPSTISWPRSPRASARRCARSARRR